MDPGSRVEDRFERMRFAGAGGAALLALGFTTLLGAGCVSLNQRLRLLGAQNTPCGELLAGHPALVAEEGYAKEPQPLRENYEGRVAHCHLVSGDHDAALELAARWSDDFDEKLRITAIAAARRGDEGACQAALQRFSSRSSRDVGDIGRFLLETRSFQPFRSRDWFVDLAIRAWAAEPTMDLDEFVSALVRAGGPRLVTLHLATADADLRPGGWALWVGVARGSRIDRENNQTLVYAEGVDITRELVAIDKDITSLEVEEKPSSSSSSRRYEYDATYRKERLYIEAFKPNGQRFIVKYPQVRERLVDIPVIVAFGRYAGRQGEDGPPVLHAHLVAAREPREFNIAPRRTRRTRRTP